MNELPKSPQGIGVRADEKRVSGEARGLFYSVFFTPWRCPSALKEFIRNVKETLSTAGMIVGWLALTAIIGILCVYLICSLIGYLIGVALKRGITSPNDLIVMLLAAILGLQCFIAYKLWKRG
jgi:hypothetical protein